MSARLIMRTLTPAGWLLCAVVLIAALFLLGRGLGLSWDPFGFDTRRLQAVERRADAAVSEAAARALEVEGAAVLARRVEHHHQQAVELARVTAVADAEARNADDSHLPMDPDRAGRLRGHDRELCRLAPAVCGAAPAEPAGNGGDAVPSGPVAGRPDAG